MKYLIERMTENHWERVKEIYLQGIHSNLATFQTVAPEWEIWNSGHIKDCCFVAIVEGKVAGWVAMSLVSSRCCYQGIGEVSLYVDEVFKERNWCIPIELFSGRIGETGLLVTIFCNYKRK